MKTLIPFLLLFLSFPTLYAQDLTCNDRKAISEKLKMIREADQGIRSRIIKEMATKDPEAMKKIALEMKASDKQNQLLIGSLLDQCGWPKGLDEIENNTIFLVIDHADTAFIAKYFPILKLQSNKGIVAKRDLATLQDRMQLRSGKKQSYGTQTLKTGNMVTIWPIDDVQNLDQRRKEMGLLPMNEYINLLKKTYQSEVIWDKDLSIEAAQEKMRKKN
ncbi:hypothetical protein EV200_101173 [Pedobacter psychrotolerans]|uniref:Uncharacterized protein n=2 Tax=Pedobacter psychrotolerans TaxID=1843235 RepID=A0A4R2HLY4_9SPHI|nr:DUF6624 domain-containing protein [Pedobacter psychrotolerans]TCO30735.1 hypothetical protein EV200_101173 [Pedobacter psychrotolerans]